MNPFKFVFAVLLFFYRQLCNYFKILLGLPPRSKFLDGNFAPVHDELTDTILRKEGSVPKDFKEGVYVRTGSNPQYQPRSRYHWFDGDGMIHAVRIDNGEAKYSNRYIRTSKFKHEKEVGRNVSHGVFAYSNPFVQVDYALQKLTGRVTEIPDMMDTGNTALVYHNNKLLALNEGGKPYEINVKNLSTKGVFDFGGALLDKNNTFRYTAHPKIDPVNGHLVGFDYNMFGSSGEYLRYFVLGKKGEVLANSYLEKEPHRTLLHDFLITENYSIFIFWSIVFDLTSVIEYDAPIYYDSKRNVKIAVIPRLYDRNKHKAMWFEARPAAGYHNANAFEKDGKIVIRTCRMRDFDLGFDHHYDPARLYQFVINPADGSLSEKELEFSRSDGCTGIVTCDFPFVNPNKVGREHRYIWASHAPEDPNIIESNAVVKFDMLNNTCLIHSYGEEMYGGEWSFVPRESSEANHEEDEGYLVGYIYDKKSGLSSLQILDASSLALLCTFTIPRRVPYGFHGTYITE